MRAAMMEEFRVAEEGREANVRLNQLSQEEVSHATDPKAKFHSHFGVFF